MSTVQQIETAIQELTAREKSELSAWFHEHLALNFDAELERGIGAGIFDSLVEEALVDHKAGETRSLPGA